MEEGNLFFSYVFIVLLWNEKYNKIWEENSLKSKVEDKFLLKFSKKRRWYDWQARVQSPGPKEVPWLGLLNPMGPLPAQQEGEHY